ncbi:unnamed protein product [Mytilus coruscus]|uniref:HARBI1 n=1 Tax=Mytilus coruscus TaxID=42192 RepID=A0A6J8AYR2_MYTCO|nr:unnamed protein product [Mytilus coruscus]
MAAFMQVPVPPHRKEKGIFCFKDDLSLNLSNEELRERFAQGTVSRIVSDVLNSLCDKRDEFIKWPRNVDETRGDFYRLSGFPNVLGAIDGTHVRIQAPSEDESSFVYRKGIRMTPGKACKIIIACAILNNICILLNEPDIEDDGVIVGNDGDLGEHFNGHQDGRAVRDHISTTCFNH